MDMVSLTGIMSPVLAAVSMADFMGILSTDTSHHGKSELPGLRST